MVIHASLGIRSQKTYDASVAAHDAWHAIDSFTGALVNDFAKISPEKGKGSVANCHSQKEKLALRSDLY